MTPLDTEERRPVAAVEVKTCRTCRTPFERRPGEQRHNFKSREYCGDTCRNAGRARKRGAKPGLSTSPPPPADWRVVDGVRRPNAPGWPDRPAIPARLAGATS